MCLAPACHPRIADIDTSRLNFRHNLAVSVNNGFLLHPSIPSNPKNIADVGTGNGYFPRKQYFLNRGLICLSIWLEDLHKRSRSRELVEDRRFDGFDVSPARFPKNSSCTYQVHDMSMPFPEQYHGLYDLVHVRYMALTLKKDQYVSAAENLMDLLSKSLTESHHHSLNCNPQSLAVTSNGKRLIMETFHPILPQPPTRNSSVS